MGLLILVLFVTNPCGARDAARHPPVSTPEVRAWQGQGESRLSAQSPGDFPSPVHFSLASGPLGLLPGSLAAWQELIALTF